MFSFTTITTTTTTTTTTATTTTTTTTTSLFPVKKEAGTNAEIIRSNR